MQAAYYPAIASRECQVEPETVATDSFLVNLQSVLLRFAEPFMDANYTKVSINVEPILHRI
jgi:ubiquitin conjugation factor E4 B